MEDKKEKEFTKDDQGKRRWSLLDFEALEPVVDVMEMGAKKYGIGNWKRLHTPTDIQRCIDAILRHTLAYQNGEQLDPESGVSHMAHIICNAMFILHAERVKEKKEEVRGQVDDTATKGQEDRFDKLERLFEELEELRKAIPPYTPYIPSYPIIPIWDPYRPYEVTY